MIRKTTSYAVIPLAAISLWACSGKQSDQVVSDASVETVEQAPKSAISTNLPEYAAYFEPESLARPLSIVNCEVSGVDTTCLSVNLKSTPGGSYTVGPFCPATITDTANQGGVWIKNASNVVHSVDGNFITTLAKLYDDENWQMYDPETGKVFHTVGEQCQLAANPNPDPALANYCVECLVSDLDANLTASYLIPIHPSQGPAGATGGNRGGGVTAGITFSGSVLDRSAPLNLIESNYNIAPFDKCGGHINPNVGYHIHAVTDDCLIEIPNTKGHASQIGIAMDGYSIFERMNDTGEPADLDQCRGHSSDVATYDLDVGYHYHVNAAGENQILPCLTGLTPQQAGDRQAGGPDRGGQGPGGQPPNFQEAATKLGVSNDDLMQAMREAGGRQADLKKVAATLGVSEEQLREALPKR